MHAIRRVAGEMGGEATCCKPNDPETSTGALESGIGRDCAERLAFSFRWCARGILSIQVEGGGISGDWARSLAVSHRCSGASQRGVGPLGLLQSSAVLRFRSQVRGQGSRGRLGLLCFPLQPLFHGTFQRRCLLPGNVTAKASKASRIVTMQDAVHRATAASFHRRQ